MGGCSIRHNRYKSIYIRRAGLSYKHWLKTKWHGPDGVDGRRGEVTLAGTLSTSGESVANIKHQSSATLNTKST